MRAGLTVLVLEHEADVYPHPRVGVLDGEALRTLQKAGVYERGFRHAPRGRRPVGVGSRQSCLDDAADGETPGRAIRGYRRFTFRDTNGRTGNARTLRSRLRWRQQRDPGRDRRQLVGSAYTDTWLILDAKLPEPVAHIPYFQMPLDPAEPV
ncbi:hypothetical protein [Nocardia abscessus]|uniref:hypothetical protein n=1 Tax=Nocardia abscessus TaxID=120957 RepID=UPI003CC7C938